MEKEIRRDLVISGVGTASGGTFNEVKVNGEGKIHGDLDSNYFKIYGKTHVMGNVKSKTVDVHGASEITGYLEADQFKINGKTDVDGHVSSKRVKIYGATNIGGNLIGEEIELKGYAMVKGDCEAEMFLAEGGFTIEGLLNAGNIDVRLYGNCQAREVGGETIKIRKSGIGFGLKTLIKSLFMQTDIAFSADTIEGDDIYLEYTKAKVVRGNNVRIGQGCEIELVEYTNHFQQDQGAKVDDSKKV